MLPINQTNQDNQNDNQYDSGVNATIDPSGNITPIDEGDSILNIDFLPHAIKLQRIRRKRLIRQGCLLGICIVALVLLTLARQDQITQIRKNLVELQQCRTNLQRQVAMIEPLEKQLSELLIKKRIDNELGSRTSCTAVLAELCRVTPASILLRTLELKTVEIPIGTKLNPTSFSSGTGFRPTGSAMPAGTFSNNKSRRGTTRRTYITFTGLAPSDVDVANFIGQLASSPFFENVSMGYAKTVIFREKPVREFKIGCYLTR